MASGKVNVTERETHLIKQHSEEWLQLRQEVHMTGSTAYNVLGFSGGEEMRQHYDEFIHNLMMKLNRD